MLPSHTQPLLMHSLPGLVQRNPLPPGEDGKYRNLSTGRTPSSARTTTAAAWQKARADDHRHHVTRVEGLSADFLAGAGRAQSSATRR